MADVDATEEIRDLASDLADAGLEDFEETFSTAPEADKKPSKADKDAAITEQERRNVWLSIYSAAICGLTNGLEFEVEPEPEPDDEEEEEEEDDDEPPKPRRRRRRK